MSTGIISYPPPAVLLEYQDLLVSSLETLKSIHTQQERDVSKEFQDLYASYMLPLIEYLTGAEHPPEITHPSEITDESSLFEIETELAHPKTQNPFSILSKTMRTLKNQCAQRTTDPQNLFSNVSVFRDGFLNSRLSETLLSLKQEPDLSDKAFVQKCSPKLCKKLEELSVSGSYSETELDSAYTAVASILQLLNTAGRARKIEALIQGYDERIETLEQEKQGGPNSISDKEFIQNCSPELCTYLETLKVLGAYKNDDLTGEYAEIAGTLRPLNKARKAIKIRDLIDECNERIKKFIQIDDQDFVKQHSSELHGLLENAHDLEGLTPKDRVSEWEHTRNDIEKASEEDRKTVIREMLLDLEERIVIAEEDDGSFS